MFLRQLLCPLLTLLVANFARCQHCSLPTLFIVNFVCCQLFFCGTAYGLSTHVSLPTLSVINFVCCQLCSSSTLFVINFVVRQLCSLSTLFAVNFVCSAADGLSTHVSSSTRVQTWELLSFFGKQPNQQLPVRSDKIMGGGACQIIVEVS